MVSIEFLVTSLVVVLLPGTGVIYTISTGLFAGWKQSLFAAIGCTLGIVPHLLACILGLSAIMHMSSVAFQIIKYAGAFYLLFLAWSMWRETGGMTFSKTEERNGLFKIAFRGFLINILNPKLSMFFLAFLPLFVRQGESIAPMVQLLILSSIFMGLTLVIFILYGTCAHLVSVYVTGSPKMVTRLQRSFAIIFAGLGVKLMATEQ